MPDERYQAQIPIRRFFRPFRPGRPPFGPPGRQEGPPFGPPVGPPAGPPSGPPTRPPVGPPAGPPIGPPTGPPSGIPGQQVGPPQGPPPSFVPQQTGGGFGVRAVDPGSIRPCIFRFVYIWLENGRQFWAWLTFVGPRSIAGWRWNGFRWVYFGTDLDNISSFVCY